MAGKAGSIRWKGKPYMAAIRRHLIRRLDVVGEAVADRVRENVGIQGPPPSSPGEYPHRDTGELQASVEHRIDMATMSVGIRATADHAKYVEKIRPFMGRTLAEMSNTGEIVHIINE